MSLFSKFRHDTRGNIALMFAMTLSLVTIVVSVSIETMRLHHEQTKLQHSLDAAALAAVKLRFSDGKSDESVKQTINEMLEQNGHRSQFTDTSCMLHGWGATVPRLMVSCKWSYEPWFGPFIGKEKIEFTANSQVVIERPTKLDIAFVYDISDSMETSNSVETLKDVLRDYLNNMENIVKDYDVSFSMIPFANSVSFSKQNFSHWVEVPAINSNVPSNMRKISTSSKQFENGKGPISLGPVPEYDPKKDFRGCFLPEAAMSTSTFTGTPGILPPAPEVLTNKGVRHCPENGFTQARFVLRNAFDAHKMVNKIQTYHGTATDEALMWGYRSIHPDWRGVISTKKKYPSDFGEHNRKIIILLTDGKPYNVPWDEVERKKLSREQIITRSANKFRRTCRLLKRKDESFDIYTIGFGEQFRKDKGTEDLLKSCTKGKGIYTRASKDDLSSKLSGILATLEKLRIEH